MHKYDLPLYHRPDGKYILHRIIGVKEHAYVIRGDNTYAKEYVPDEWIIGYVSEFYRARRKGGERHVDTSARGYRFYAAFWNFVYPVRWVGYQAFRVVRKLWRMIRRK